MRLKGLDLNLLVALDVLLEERSVSRAAERLYVRQPAASAALGRLRDYFKDDILVLHGKRMIPTSYAEDLQPEVRRILRQVDGMISMSTEFDPLRIVVAGSYQEPGRDNRERQRVKPDSYPGRYFSPDFTSTPYSVTYSSHSARSFSTISGCFTDNSLRSAGSPLM